METDRHYCNTCNKKRFEKNMEKVFSSGPGKQKWKCLNNCNEIKQTLSDSIILQTESTGEPEIYSFLDGTKITIGKGSIDFFNKLIKLPADKKIFLMEISENEMELFILKEKEKKRAIIKKLFSKKYIYSSTGEDAPKNDIFEYMIPIKNFKGNIKNSTIEEMNIIIEAYNTSEIRER